MYEHFDFTTPLSAEAQHDQEVRANKLMRLELDENLANLKRCPPTRERSLAITKLQESIMWLGVDLKRLGEENPYEKQFPINCIITDADGNDFQCICSDDHTAVFAKVVDPPNVRSPESLDWIGLFALSQHVGIENTSFRFQL